VIFNPDFKVTVFSTSNIWITVQYTRYKFGWHTFLDISKYYSPCIKFIPERGVVWIMWPAF